MSVPVAPGALFAGHRLQAEIGRGGMGVVYLAHHLALDRRAAVKVIAEEFGGRADFRTRFSRESRIVARIDHPNVVPVQDAGEQEGTLYIAMPLVEGVDLGALIGIYGRLSPALAGRLVGQVASALHTAHGLGLVHRDIKPANILVTAREGCHHAYLTDFGLAKSVAGGSEATAADTVLGTIDYIAPEQIESAATVDGRADIYALGCVLFHALTGDVPFPRPTTPKKLWAHLHELPPSMLESDDSIPPAFQAVVRRALEKDPERRFATADEMRRALDAAMRGAAPAGIEPDTVPGGVGAAPPVARRGGRLLTETELLERFRGRTELSLEAIGAGPTWRSYAARTQFDERGLLTEATRRLVARYGYFALHLLEDVDDLPDLLEAEGADPQPDPDGTYWSQQDDDPRTRGWVALRAHGNLVVSAHLDVRSSGDTHWSEVTDLAGRLAHS